MNIVFPYHITIIFLLLFIFPDGYEITKLQKLAAELSFYFFSNIPLCAKIQEALESHLKRYIMSMYTCRFIST